MNHHEIHQLQVDLPFADDETVRSFLESSGLRCTQQRLEVFRYLQRQMAAHPSADEVFLAVRQVMPSISLATVYKALDALVACGLISKLADGGDGSARFDARPEQHYHLRCTKSGRVQDLDTPYEPELVQRLDPELPAHLARQGFHLTGYRLELLGYFDEAAPGGERVENDP
jgi:Fe2+ or Zn2+ uptake regulation protein